MSRKPKPDDAPVKKDAKDAKPAADPTKRDGKQVIMLVSGNEETGQERLLKKVIPACVISGALHVAIAGTFLLFGSLFGTTKKAEAAPPPLAMESEQEKEKMDDLTKTNEGLDTEQDTSIEVQREAAVTIEAPKVTEDPIGTATDNKVAMDSLAVLGALTDNPIEPGTKLDLPGVGQLGTGGAGGSATVNSSMTGRSAATRDKLVTSKGGSSDSQLAVGRGLAWLANQQRNDGSWVWDGSHSKDVAASTGLALLPFLAAGQTHKVADWKGDNGQAVIKYKQTVMGGLIALLKMQKPDGSFRGSSTQYTHAIATVALCEAYGMTGDKTLLLHPAQMAINYMMAGQGVDGSWGYQPRTNGDTSIVGWQIQALQSAKLSKDMVVDKRVLEKARSFLDSVAEGSNKAKYGYRGPKGTPTLTSVGLLCRYYLDGWGPNNPGMADGVDYLRKSIMPGKGKTFDMYYYYYASQVMHFHDGAIWKEWNVLMRDWLIDLQVKDASKPKEFGSWDKDAHWMGSHTGRLGTTCMSLLTLEIYYRHTPLYKRDQGGLKLLEGIGGK